MISTEGEITVLHAKVTGLFVPADGAMMKYVQFGEHIGDIVAPLTGRLLHRVEAPCEGRIFTFREYPVVYEGAILCRIFTGGKQNG